MILNVPPVKPEEKGTDMSQYKIKLLVLGQVSTNCYTLYKEDSKKAVLFDPADAPEQIEAVLTQLGLELEAILLTHGHFDHIMAANCLKDMYGVPVIAHEEEAEVAGDCALNLSVQFGGGYSTVVDRTVKDGETLSLAGFSMKVLHTPGHTKGSACYYLEQEGILFSGDTLFAASVGRSDFPTGSGSELIRSIRTKLAVLPDDTEVYPGHGEQTDIGYEKHHNPFI